MCAAFWGAFTDDDFDLGLKSSSVIWGGNFLDGESLLRLNIHG
jgi:hypothetical protein